jgi:hypothetical protein
MPSKLRLVIGASAIVLAIGYVITAAVCNTAEYYLTVNEVSAGRASLRDRCFAWPGGLRRAR